MLELRGLQYQLKMKRKGQCMIVLFVQFKGEDQYKDHQIPCVNATKSRIKVKYTIQRLVWIKEALALTMGPTISNIKCILLQSINLDELFHKLLIESLR